MNFTLNVIKYYTLQIIINELAGHGAKWSAD